jgi:N-acetylglucosamine kinase-like BadF-type ATPase
VSAGRGLLLAVDGGNSKTLAAVADLAGTILASARGAGSDIYGRGSVDVALGALSDTVRRALVGAGTEAADLEAAVFSLAGADWPEDFALLEAQLTARLGLRRRPTLVNDALGGLRVGSARWEGVAVVCGTFNAVGARHRDGRMFHLGFWPDRVGGFDLGMEALKAVYRHALDLGPPTRLTERALACFEAADPLALLHAFTRREAPISPWKAQRLAPVLLDLADQGDAVARSIVRQGGRTLGEQARVCAARVGLPVQGIPLVLTGGVLQHPSPVLVDAILERLPGATPIRALHPPLLGAVLLAYDELGRSVEPEPLGARLSELVADAVTRNGVH